LYTNTFLETPHLQAFISFKQDKSFSFVKKCFPTAHIEGKARKSTYQQAAAYCRKDNNYTEHGILPIDPHVAGGVKQKENWEEIRERAKSGDIDSLPGKIYVTHYRNLKAIAEDNMLCEEDLPDVCGEWIYGPPGVGKSHRARAENPGAYIKSSNNKWFTAYRGQDVVILDEMELDAAFMGHSLKIWADKYKFQAESKGGGFVIRPKKFVVTSNYSIEEIFGAGTQMALAIARRFKVIHITALPTFRS